MIKLIFIRHGATKGNLERRYIGITDEPLSDVGIEQIKKLKKENFKTDYLFTSPLIRTRQSATILFPNMEYKIIKEFTEVNFGIFENKTAEELSNCEKYKLWLDSMCKDPIPNGENIQKFKKRCSKAFINLISEIPDGKITTFILHGGVIMSILEKYALPQKNFYEYELPNAGFINCVSDKKNLFIDK